MVAEKLAGLEVECKEQVRTFFHFMQSFIEVG